MDDHPRTPTFMTPTRLTEKSTPAEAENKPLMTVADVRVLERQTAYSGYFSIVRYRLQHRLYAGGWGPDFSREVFSRGHAVAVVLYDPDQDRLVLIEQFRVGAFIAGLEAPDQVGQQSPWLLEVVAGIIDSDETAEEVARREALEEAGCPIYTLLPIQTIMASPGGTSESIALFLGLCKAPAHGSLHGLADEHEDIRVLVASPDEVWAWMDSGRIINGPGLVALMWFRIHQATYRSKDAELSQPDLRS